MNCVILEKGTKNILHFIKNCSFEKVDEKRIHLTGDNHCIANMKVNLYDIIWTNADEGKELTPVPTYKDIPVGCRADIDEVTKKRIRELYSIEDELKALRIGEKLPDVESIIAEGKEFKDKYFPKEELRCST